MTSAKNIKGHFRRLTSKKKPPRKSKTPVQKDYLAICYILAGSCFGRAPTKEAAIEICRKEANAFANAFGGFKAEFTDLKINVYDSTGYDAIMWDDFGVRADGHAEPLGPPEVVTVNPHKKFKLAKDSVK